MPGPHSNRFFTVRELALLQDSRRWRLVSTLGPDGLESPPRRRRPGRQRVSTHAHPYPEILLALEGTAFYGVDGRPVKCIPGTVVFLNNGVSHDLGYAAGGRQFRHIWFRIVQENVFVELHRHGRKVVDAEAWACLFPLPETGIDFQRLWADCFTGEDPACRRLRLQTILGGILARLIDEGNRAPSATPDVLKQAIEAIRRHIDETGGRDASLDEEIGARLGCSCSASFSRWCHRHCAEIAAIRRPGSTERRLRRRAAKTASA